MESAARIQTEGRRKKGKKSARYRNLIEEEELVVTQNEGEGGKGNWSGGGAGDVWEDADAHYT